MRGDGDADQLAPAEQDAPPVWHYHAIEYRGADRRVSMTERRSMGAMAGVGSWCDWVDAGAVAIRAPVDRPS